MNSQQGRIRTLMDLALDQTFREIRHGGDHESRKLIATQIEAAVLAGKTSLDELVVVGRRAMLDLNNRARLR